jgi:selenide,water dikinase
MEPVRLTQYARAGENCRIDPVALGEIVAPLTPLAQPGFAATHPVAASAFDERQTLLVANEFFTPIVDDPRAYGRIAAASALGAIYGCGGVPLLAAPIIAFPVNVLPLNVMQDILRGGAEACAEAGVPLGGGHGIAHDVPVFGLSVAGLARAETSARRNRAQAGDRLVLTKPLGTGILRAAARLQRLAPAASQRLVGVMSALNAPGGWLGAHPGVHALGMVGAAGLAGLAVEMACAGGVSLSIDAAAVPVLEEAWALAAEGIVPRDAQRNLATHGTVIRFGSDVAPDARLVFADPQISGGLLLAVAADAVELVLAYLRKTGALAADVIGQVQPRGEGVRVVFDASRPLAR